MAITFLHAADIHLDSPLKGLERYEGAPLDRMRRATRRALTRLIDLAGEKSVDFVLIAGDLYDGDWRDFSTGLFLAQQLRRLEELEIPVFIIAGNHDAANKMTRDLRLPPNVRFLAHERPETAVLDDLGVAIHGQSFAKAAVTENLAAAYPAPLSGYVNIGMLHTGLGGVDGHERYAPCSLEELRRRGYDYWALGHIHARQELWKDPPIVFPGNVQGRHIREAGPKGCVIATIRPNQTIEHVFHRLDQVRWARGDVDVSGLESESDALDCTAVALDRVLASEPDPESLLAVRVILSGTTDLSARLYADSERLIAEVRNLATAKAGDRLWIEKVEIRARPQRAITVPDGPIDELLEVMQQARADPGLLRSVIDELADLKRKLPSELLHDADGPRLDDAGWLQARLEQVQPLLLDILLETDGDPLRRPAR
jgi:DNA repair exonuclease SbcCD nuclease subunit